MKKLSVVVVAITLAVSMFSVASAGNRQGMMGGGCGNCGQQGASSDPFRKYQADTLDLRQEMMMKRFEVQRENLKGTPDSAKVAALQAEIKVLQAKILEVRTQSGLPADKCDGECNQNIGDCNKRGMKPCGSGPCSQK